jgi:hypothetical protein
MLWPSAIALGFLVFLGAIGQGNALKTASADTGDICLILSNANVVDGEFQMAEDETILVVAIVESESFDDDLELFDASVDLDDEIGDSDITSRAVEDDDNWDYDTDISTDFLNEVGIIQGGDDTGDLDDALDDDFSDDDDDDTSWTTDLQDADGEMPDAAPGDNLCGDSDEDVESDLADALLAALVQCIDENVEMCDGSGDECVNCVITWENKSLVLPDVAEAAAAIIMDIGWQAFFDFISWDGDPGEDCVDADVDDDDDLDTDSLGAADFAFYDEFEDWLLLEYNGEITHGPGVPGDEAEIDNFGASDSELLAGTFCVVMDEYLDVGEDDELGIEGWIVIDVTCFEAGTFEVSFSIHGENEDSESATFNCRGDVDEGLITATPNKVEIIPAMGSVAYSLIVVELLDSDGEPVDGVVEVDFETDRCVFLDEDGLSEEDYLEVVNLFEEYDPNDPDTAEAIAEAMDDVDNDDDSDDVSNTVDSFILDDDTDDFAEGDNIAAVILDCHDEDTTPGIANVCFQVDDGGEDVEDCVKVTVVGPPAKVTAAAAPASLICGEKATISVEVLDSANQPVSDHTRVEAVTNLGGVLAGTGAVAGQAGLVTPVSSTVAETFNGKATLYLLTSDAHTGPYEVVVASGGQGSVNTGLGGVFSTAPQVTQVTVVCTQPAAAPAPTVTAPRTGTGTISPPNTGDAGLADQGAGSSWALIAVAGVVAFSVAGLATLKFSRR